MTNHSKLLLALLATVAVAGCAASSVSPQSLRDGEGLSSIRGQCEDQWGDNWSSVAMCVDGDTRGYREVQRYVKDHDIRDGDTSPQADILAKCYRQWQPRWSSIAMCVDSDWRGYQRLEG